MQTPRFWGQACIAGVLDFLRTASRPWRTSWLMVGIGLHRRERRQNSHFITECPRLVNSRGGPEMAPTPPNARRAAAEPGRASMTLLCARFLFPLLRPP